MKKIYYLKTCDTCRRVLKEMDTTEYVLQEIKSNPITVKQLDELFALTNNYEAIFSKLSKKIQANGFKKPTTY